MLQIHSQFGRNRSLFIKSILTVIVKIFWLVYIKQSIPHKLILYRSEKHRMILPVYDTHLQGDIACVFYRALYRATSETHFHFEPFTHLFITHLSVYVLSHRTEHLFATWMTLNFLTHTQTFLASFSCFRCHTVSIRLSKV